MAKITRKGIGDKRAAELYGLFTDASRDDGLLTVLTYAMDSISIPKGMLLDEYAATDLMETDRRFRLMQLMDFYTIAEHLMRDAVKKLEEIEPKE